MTIELVLSAMMFALALIALSRKSVRRRLAASTRRVRVQYAALILLPTWLLAVLFWFDIWQRVSGHGFGEASRDGLATDEERMERGYVVCDAIYAYCQSQS